MARKKKSMEEKLPAASTPSTIPATTTSIEAGDTYDSENGGDNTEGSLLDELEKCSEDQFMAFLGQMPGLRSRVRQWILDAAKAGDRFEQRSEVTISEHQPSTVISEMGDPNPNLGTGTGKAQAEAANPASAVVWNAADVAKLKKGRSRIALCSTEE